ncbi:hypothetical protein SAMD00019534_072190 [Acytostelium subglobosum LB1]|uniref:hypothetical protein n=1 Tax=Acytostelium subglobosum LB1 TaxID=1410327 RepID=UPI0006448AA9|nr:hypothetical protein SAMD00019534_072190 [Acytostelium subglobosum LB1]GAM24044.1 hypothetical protein SAMD00019534_072190 [Acytostelium subglobosum LB1]|eukprot:XP_012753080.1 hypothetical protein SAMD00019534_072190 [Acytostelium subglobosum LB1]
MPKIVVNEAGTLSYPVTPEQVQKLVERATRAPYGKGTETITDLNVRRVWQIQNTDISITGNKFTEFFNGVINSIKESMGLADETVTAELYKMLIYDKGGFFLPHRDSEKAVKMFGTLVLSLPCSHRGGDLVIAHSGKEMIVSLENDSISSIKWTAFFADCRHEVKPVTEGNRVCLVYNLMRSGARKLVPTPNSDGRVVDALNKVFCIKVKNEDDEGDDDAKVLKKSKTSTTTTTSTKVDDDDNDDYPEKIAYCLEHVYSMANCTLESLKGNDASLARTLLSIADKAQIKLGFAFIHCTESGPYEGGYYGEQYGDVEDKSLTLTEVKDMLTGEYLSNEMELDDAELMPNGCMEDVDPYDEEAEEATGNEGGSFEKFYRQSAIVIWSTARTGVFTMVASLQSALNIFKREVKKLGGIDVNPQATLDQFTKMMESLFRLRAKYPDDLTLVLTLLATIKDDRFMHKLLKQILQRYCEYFTLNLHQDLLLSLLRRPSMTPEAATELVKLALHHSTFETSMAMLLAMLAVPNPPANNATMLPAIVQLTSGKLKTMPQCDQLRECITKHAVFEQQRTALMAPIDAMVFKVWQQSLDVMTFTQKIQEIDRLLVSLATGATLPNYMSIANLKTTFTSSILKSSTVHSYYTNNVWSTILPALPILERIKAAQPEWITQDPNYSKMLSMLLKYQPNYFDDNTNANNLNMIWRALHSDGTGPHMPGLISMITQANFISASAHIMLLAPHRVYRLAPLLLVLGLRRAHQHCDGLSPASHGPRDTSQHFMPMCQLPAVLSVLSLTSYHNVYTLRAKETDRRHILQLVNQYRNVLSYTTSTTGTPRTLEVRKITSAITHQAEREKHTTACNNCHSILQLRPPGRFSDALTGVVANTPAPIVYPHTRVQPTTTITKINATVAAPQAPQAQQAQGQPAAPQAPQAQGQPAPVPKQEVINVD